MHMVLTFNTVTVQIIQIGHIGHTLDPTAIGVYMDNAQTLLIGQWG